jgi:hypothetical protein
MGISVKKRPKFFPDIAKYADPTAAKRTKPKVKPKKEEDYEIGHKGGGKIMYRSKGGQVFNGNDFVIQANNYKEM